MAFDLTVESGEGHVQVSHPGPQEFHPEPIGLAISSLGEAAYVRLTRSEALRIGASLIRQANGEDK